mgnify:FL=1
MLLFSVETAFTFLDETLSLTKKQKQLRLSAEIILTTRTTPNNIFIGVCGKGVSYLFYWISRGRERYNILKFNNFFSLKKMFIEVVAFIKKYKQIIYKFKTKGRGKSKGLTKELKFWKIPLFYFISTTKRAFNGCKFPHSRRI